MVNLELVDWLTISHQELDWMLKLSEFIDINKELRQQQELTPLCLACKFNREDLVTVLLDHGAHTNQDTPRRGKQPLHYACDHRSGNIGIVRKLLQAGAHVDSCATRGRTGLHISCLNDNAPVVELLCEAGADVNLAANDETALVMACLGNRFEIMNILMKHGCDPNAFDGMAMEMAVLVNSHESVKILVTGGVDLNKGDYLAQACHSNNINMMKVLINHGIDVNLADKIGRTPLHTACLHWNTGVECVHLLLKAGAKPNVLCSFGYTEFYYAAITENMDKVRLLLAYGADVNKCNLYILSAMITDDERLCISRFYIQAFKLMIAAGIQLSLRNLRELKDEISYTQENSYRMELNELIDKHSKQPLSLQALCRINVRSNMKPNIDVNMRTLPLPQHVIKYLNFSDIVNEPIH